LGQLLVTILIKRVAIFDMECHAASKFLMGRE
jgi:hypothetical protein